MNGAYTISAVCAPILIVALELTVLRTGILRRPRFWAALAITLAFQVPVDGWLTKLGAPIVLYRARAISGVRWPWDIPVEDDGFAIAMITLTLALWERALRQVRARRSWDERMAPYGFRFHGDTASGRRLPSVPGRLMGSFCRWRGKAGFLTLLDIAARADKERRGAAAEVGLEVIPAAGPLAGTARPGDGEARIQVP